MICTQRYTRKKFSYWCAQRDTHRGRDTSSGGPGTGQFHLGLQVQEAPRPALLSTLPADLRPLDPSGVTSPSSASPATAEWLQQPGGGEDQPVGAGIGWNCQLQSASG